MGVIAVKWVKCLGEVWCNLNNVNLSHSHFEGLRGVYVIWHGAPNPATVYTGKGPIREKIAAARTDPRIQEYSHFSLYVTWAHVPDPDAGGVLGYLSSRLAPKVREWQDFGPPVGVNLPW